jgi:tetratricopeptide (TPR) repeat protein
MTKKARRAVAPSHVKPATNRRWLAAALLVALVAGAGWAAYAFAVRRSVDAVVGDLAGTSPEVAAAIARARDSVVGDSGDGARWAHLGMVCEANGLPGAALRAYQEALDRSPDDARWWYRRALVETRLGDHEAAVSSIARAAELNRGYPPLFWRRGLWLLDRGEVDAAREAFDEAIRLAGADPAGYAGLARVHLARREDQQAVDTLERLLAAHPGDRYALQLLGTAYRRLGRLEEAEYMLSAGATGEPLWNDPWSDELSSLRVGFAATLKEATARVLAGHFETAIPLLERLRSERPDDVALMNQLALSYVAAGRRDAGLQLLEQSLAIEPDNVETHLRLSSVRLQRNDVERALGHANKAVALSPRLARAQEARGLALWRLGNLDTAMAAMGAAIRYDPRNLQARAWIGYILMERGDHQSAAEQFALAARRNPTFAPAFVGLGLARMNLGDLTGADEAIARAAALDPQSPQVAEARALLQAKGEREKRF